MAFSLEQPNDPLMKNVFEAMGTSGFVEAKAQKYFQLDYSQYIELIRASYNATSAKDQEFSKDICFSAYQYYCVFILWWRLYSILRHRGLRIAEVEKIRELLGCHVLPVLPDIHLYLQGIGDLKDMLGNDYLIDIQGTLSGLCIGQAQGSYGVINTHNYIDYETLPSLLVTLLKIKADIVESHGTIWNLPTELRPTAMDAVHPTRNLLGWWPAEALTDKQKKYLSKLWVSDQGDGDFDVDNIGCLPVSYEIIMTIAHDIEHSRIPFEDMPTSRYGSVAQIPFITRAPEDIRVDHMKSVAGKLGCTNSCIQIHGTIANAAAIFRYRTKRREYKSADMVAYKFVNDRIPTDILENENKVFECGIAETLWNRRVFRISEQDGCGLVNSYTNKIRERRDGAYIYM